MKNSDKRNKVAKSKSKYDNDLNRTTEINGYSAFEQNIFFLIASKFTQSNETSITIPMGTIFDICNGSYHNKQIVAITKNLGERIANLNFYKHITMDDGKKALRIGHLFSYIDITSDYVCCSLDPLFVNYFRHISNPFTEMDLSEFYPLSSKYSKTLYRCLSDLTNYGHPEFKGSPRYIWSVDINDYREILKFPLSYKVGRITFITNECINELLEMTSKFKNIELRPVYDSHKRGRPVTRFEFFYTFKPLQVIQNQQKNMLNPAKVPAKVPEKLCPLCNKPVVLKNGAFGPFVGHAYKGTCEKTWASWEAYDKDCNRIAARAAGVQTPAIPADQMQYLEQKMKKDFQNAKSDDKNSNLKDIKGMIAEILNDKKEL